MILDYRTMTPSDWIPLGIIIVLALIVCWALLFKPSIPWKSTQRYRKPTETEEELGQPTRGFINGCRIVAAVVVLMVLLCIITPFVPALTSREPAPANTGTPAPGIFKADDSLPLYDLEGFTFTPWLQIDPSDSSFVFMCGDGPRPAGFPYGHYTIDGNILTASTMDFGLVFYFEIIDSQTVKLIDANVNMKEDLFAIHSDIAQIGDVFTWADYLPE